MTKQICHEIPRNVVCKLKPPQGNNISKKYVLGDIGCNKNIHLNDWLNISHVSFLNGVRGRCRMYKIIYITMG